jgi:hypothetical protein
LAIGAGLGAGGLPLGFIAAAPPASRIPSRVRLMANVLVTAVSLVLRHPPASWPVRRRAASLSIENDTGFL